MLQYRPLTGKEREIMEKEIVLAAKTNSVKLREYDGSIKVETTPIGTLNLLHLYNGNARLKYEEYDEYFYLMIDKLEFIRNTV